MILPYITLAFNGGIKYYELDDTRCEYAKIVFPNECFDLGL